MQVLKLFQSSESEETETSVRPWEPADFEGDLSVLAWKVQFKIAMSTSCSGATKLLWFLIISWLRRELAIEKLYGSTDLLP